MCVFAAVLLMLHKPRNIVYVRTTTVSTGVVFWLYFAVFQQEHGVYSRSHSEMSLSNIIGPFIARLSFCHPIQYFTVIYVYRSSPVVVIVELFGWIRIQRYPTAHVSSTDFIIIILGYHICVA